MKERPILFSGPMVRAILAGRKTQTRRLVKGPWSVDEDPETGRLWPLFPSYVNDADNEGEPAPFDPRKAFAKLWDRINGERASWASNPWVWVIGFKRIDGGGRAE